MQICGSGVDGGKVSIIVIHKKGAIMDKPKRKVGRPATGMQPAAAVRLSPQQRDLARRAAVAAGKPRTISGGIHALLAQFAATQSGQS